jgi:hypothetical protein
LIYLALALAAGWPWAYVVYGAATLVLIVLALRPTSAGCRLAPAHGWPARAPAGRARRLVVVAAGQPRS